MKTLYSLIGTHDRADFYLEDVQHICYDKETSSLITIGFLNNAVTVIVPSEDIEIKYTHLLNQWKKATKPYYVI